MTLLKLGTTGQGSPFTARQRTGFSSPFVGRAGVCAEIVDTLTSGNSAGAVILGDPGIGKTSLLHYASLQLAERACVVALRGSASASRVSYGALSLLLTELDESALDSPLRILEGLTRLLEKRARGRDTVLAIDNAEQLDEDSILVVGQLVSSQTVRILAVCSEGPGSPQDFSAMCRASAMARFDIAPLTQEDTELFLTSALGQRASRHAVRTLFLHSRGNPRWLGLLCHDYVEGGALELRNGTWVLTGRTFTMHKGTREAICESLGSLTADQREIVDVLAATGGAPLEAMQRLSRSSDLDELQDRGVVAVSTDRALTVSLTSSLVAEAVSGGMLSRHSRQLRERVREAAPHRSQLNEDHRVQGTGADIAPQVMRHPGSDGELRVAKARVASHEGRYPDVLELLRDSSLDPDTLGPEFRELANAFVGEALAMTGRHYESLALRDRSGAAYEMHQSLPVDSSAQCMSNVRLATGVWSTENNAGSAYGPYAAVSSTLSELTDGLIRAFAGDAEEALVYLMPALRQCEASEMSAMALLAATTARYCQAMLGECVPSTGFPAYAGADPSGGPWVVERLTRHFTIMTDAAAGFRERAARDMLSAGHEDRQMGIRAFELLSLSSALRLGERRAIEPLLEASAGCQGQFARLCELYAKAMDNNDAQLMLQVMDFAQETGQRSFARDAAESARAFSIGSGSRSSSRHVHRRIVATLEGAQERRIIESVLSGLTAREAEVVQLVAEGSSNKGIARKLQVSVRTVEGHLYQAYSKLHVRNREELVAEIAGGAAHTP